MSCYFFICFVYFIYDFRVFVIIHQLPCLFTCSVMMITVWNHAVEQWIMLHAMLFIKN